MERRGQATDRYGRTWVARIVSQDEAEEEDFRFWYEELTPEERVRAVEDCTLSALKAQGLDEIPRLQRFTVLLRKAKLIKIGGPATRRKGLGVLPLFLFNKAFL